MCYILLCILGNYYIMYNVHVGAVIFTSKNRLYYAPLCVTDQTISFDSFHARVAATIFVILPVYLEAVRSKLLIAAMMLQKVACRNSSLAPLVKINISVSSP